MENENTATVTTADNSSEPSLDVQISEALNEPAETDSENPAGNTEADQAAQKTEEKAGDKTKKDNIIECPDKFKKQDGSVDIENLSKSYTELEKLRSTEQAKWQEERAELLKAKEQLDELNKLKEDNARNAGFKSAQEMQQIFEIANFEANEYFKYLNTVDEEDRANVQNLLYQYANNPTQDLMEQIEYEFSPQINKNIAIQAERKRQAFENQQKVFAETKKMSNIESVISQSVDHNPEIFNYEPFKKLFINTLNKYGDNFSFEDAKALMEAFSGVQASAKEAYKKEAGAKTANEQATDKIAAINNSSSAPAAGQEPDIDSMSPSELGKYISKYI